MDYKGFKIKKQNWSVKYGDKTSQFAHYVVFKEIDNEKYFIDFEGNTAFDTEEEARRVIDLIGGK